MFPQLSGLTLGSLVLVALAPASEADVAKAARGVKQIIAHRGASLECPENTLAAARRAIAVGATATEIDIRTSKDGVLVCSHDATLDRTTNGKGPINAHTLAELKQLDAGSWFDPKFKDERIPTLVEVLELCRGKIHILLDLKETGDDYIQRVVATVRKHGNPKEIIVGVRSVEQAKQFRQLLPEAQLLGLIPKPDDIESFAAAGVHAIRLWPKWLTDRTLVAKVKNLGLQLHINGSKGTKEEVLPLLTFEPTSLSSDDPGQLIATLRELRGKK
ncbi:MAG: glycerophosphodiester phosphodiesterase [Gemmataceae bacterium]